MLILENEFGYKKIKKKTKYACSVLVAKVINYPEKKYSLQR